jgi:hypothetical protein
MKSFKEIFIEEEVSNGMGKGHIQSDKEEFKTIPDNTKHIHFLNVNSDGDGKTLEIEGYANAHIHKIEKWVVLEVNDHIHEIDRKE